MKLIYTDFAAMTSALGQRGISLNKAALAFMSKARAGELLTHMKEG